MIRFPFWLYKRHTCIFTSVLYTSALYYSNLHTIDIYIYKHMYYTNQFSNAIIIASRSSSVISLPTENSTWNCKTQYQLFGTSANTGRYRNRRSIRLVLCSGTSKLTCTGIHHIHGRDTSTYTGKGYRQVHVQAQTHLHAQVRVHGKV